MLDERSEAWQSKLELAFFLITTGFHAVCCDAVHLWCGKPLVLTIHEEANKGLPNGTQSESHLVIKNVNEFWLDYFANARNDDIEMAIMS